MSRGLDKKVRSVASYPLSGCIGTSLSVERWFEGGMWHARAVFGDVVGPEVTSHSGEAAWFRAAAEYFEQVDAPDTEVPPPSPTMPVLSFLLGPVLSFLLGLLAGLFLLALTDLATIRYMW